MKSNSLLLKPNARSIHSLFDTESKPVAYVTFRFEIPFQLPFDDDKYIFSTKNDVGLICSEVIRKRIDNLKIYTSEVELILPLPRKLPLEMKTLFSTRLFDKGLEFLNLTIDALVLKHSYSEMRNLSLVNLPIFVQMNMFNSSVPSEESHRGGLFFVGNMPMNSKKLDKMSPQQMNELVGSIENLSHNPFSEIVRYQRLAMYDLNHGNYQESIIKLQTFIETMTFKLYKLMLLQEGLLASDITKKLKAGYKNILLKDNHFGKRMNEAGLLFDKDNPKSLTNKYWKNVYLLRNKSVHEGKRVSKQEASLAFETTKSYIDECVSVLLNHPVYSNINELEYLLMPRT